MRKNKVFYSIILPVWLLSAVLFSGCAGKTQADTAPTVTSTPSETTIPTATLLPTSTPMPTAAPTNTSTPSPEPTITPTNTPVPAKTPEPTNTLTPTPTPGPDFYKVSKTSIVDSTGTPLQLKGIAIGNMIWSSYEPPANDHNESSFRELSELGFNCVRFYLSYHFFEKDTEPYVYKESGFDWLDQNIAWAKKYGIRLILNMHAPQGGYQSQGEGLALWQEEENQNRLIALWTEIAKRYANEEAIIGYGLINEPVVPLLADTSSTVSQCSSLMQRITDSIRTVDKNHIIFVERLCAAVDPVTGIADWHLSYDDVLFLIDDPNTVYEFHCYSPHQFTHQDMDWADTAGKTATYPSEEPVIKDAVNYWTGCVPANQMELSEDGWSIFESDFASLSKESNVGSITLRAANTGKSGIALFDDIVIAEYKNGVFQRVLKTLDFESPDHTDSFYFWSADGNGSYYYTDEGYNNSQCLAMSGTTDDANVTGYHFPLQEGYEYKISGKVKLINTTATCTAQPRIDYSLYKTISYLDFDYLESELMPYIEFGQKNQVPLYLGEFGVCIPAWKSKAGATTWVTDMLTLCQQYNLHFNYHAYHDYWFGLYRLPMNDPYSKRNEELAEIFKELLK